MEIQGGMMSTFDALESARRVIRDSLDIGDYPLSAVYDGAVDKAKSVFCFVHTQRLVETARWDSD